MARGKKPDLRLHATSAALRTRLYSAAAPAPLRIFCIGVGAGAWAIGAKRACPITLVGALEDDLVARQLFRKNFGPVSPPSDRPGQVPHCDLAVVADEKKEWAREKVMAARPRIVCMERRSKKDWLSGYNCYSEVLCASEFGLSQRRKREFLVAFREDLRPGFSCFPFPDPAHGYHNATEPTLTKNSKVSMPEARELMGYPEGLELPDTKTATLRLLSNDVCVPVAKAIIGEIWTWIS